MAKGKAKYRTHKENRLNCSGRGQGNQNLHEDVAAAIFASRSEKFFLLLATLCQGVW
jgi:hypothetical protein